jgi:hypothetical protein
MLFRRRIAGTKHDATSPHRYPGRRSRIGIEKNVYRYQWPFDWKPCRSNSGLRPDPPWSGGGNPPRVHPNKRTPRADGSGFRLGPGAAIGTSSNAVRTAIGSPAISGERKCDGGTARGRFSATFRLY